jgi:hypothetical protein
LDKIKVDECYIYKTAIEKGFLHDKRASTRGADESMIEGLLLGYIENDIIYTTPKPLPTQPTTKAVPTGLFKQGPLKQATLRVLRMGLWEASRDRTLDSMGIPEARKHRWLRGKREI